MEPNQKLQKESDQVKRKDIVLKNKKISIDLEKPGKTLFGETAKDLADDLVSSDKDKKDTPTQVRKFYDEIVLWHERVERKKKKEDKEAELEKVLPYIHMIKAKLAYACGRKAITVQFYNAFNIVVDQINSPETLKNAKLFFEAYLGFAKFNAAKKAQGDNVQPQKSNQYKQTGQHSRGK